MGVTGGRGPERRQQVVEERDRGARVDSGALPEGLKNGVLGSNLDNYAWTWLIVGIVLIFSSIAILAGSQFGRWVGFFAAAIGALSAMAWMPYYPVWSLTYVGIAVLTFYALARYGGRPAT